MFGGFGQSAPSTFGGFGATPQNQTQNTGFGGFGQPAAQPQQQPSLFGAPSAPSTNTGFGTFGQSTQPSTSTGFGQPQNTTTGGFTGFGQQTQQTPSTGFGGFGSTTTAPPNTGFGGFGQPTTQPTTAGFGTTQQSNNPFGQPAPSGTTGGFGGFGTQPQQPQLGTKFKPYQVTVDRTNDTKGVPTISNYMSITCMPEYVNKSFEELRWEDETNQPASQSSTQPVVTQQSTNTGFGGFGQSQPQQQTSLFGASSTSNTGFGGFGSTTTTPSTSTGFGSFGQQAPQPQSTSGFGGFGSFGSTTQPAQQSGLFGSTGSNMFGQSSGATSGFGGFGSTTTAQPAAPSTGFGGFGGSTGSAFGSTTQPQSTGGFGFGGFGSTAASQPATGGFSMGSTQSTPAPSLFGSNTFGSAQPSTSGFGGFGQSTQPATQTSLFGSNTGTSLFGSNTASSTTGGGFGFGSTAQQPQSSSTFALGGGFGTSSTGSSLFGNTSSSTTSGFGQPSKPGGFGQQSQSASTTSLFGNTTGTSLFGQPQQQQTQSIGLFGQPSQQPQQQQSSLFGQIQQPPTQIQQPQQMIATIDQDPFMSSFLSATQSIQPTRAVPYTPSNVLPVTALSATQSLTNPLSSTQFQSIQPYTNTQSLLPRTIIPPAQSSVLQMRYGSTPMQPSPMQQRPNITQLLTQQSHNSSNQSLIDMLIPKRRLTHLAVPDEIRDEQVLNVNRSNDRLNRSQLALPSAITQSTSTPVQHRNNNNNMNDDKKYYPDISKTPQPVHQLSTRPQTQPVSHNQHDNALDNTNTYHNDSIQPAAPKLSDSTERKYDSPNNKSINTVLQQSNKSHVPILTRPLYYTIPSLDELSTMSTHQLQHIEYFVIGHEQYGRIEWDDVDITDLNLDDIVVFDRNAKTKTCSVEVYGDTYHGVIPPLGEKLNKPATISLQCWPIDYEIKQSNQEQMKKLDRYEIRLRDTTEKMGAEFIEYEKQQGIWIFAVSGFT